MQDAANTLQFHIIKGISQCVEELSIINVLPVNSYPKYYKRLIVSRKEFTVERVKESFSVGFINLVFVRRFFMKRAVKNELLKWMKKNPDNREVIVYTMDTHLLQAVTEVKRMYPDLHVCAIVSDLPSMANLSNNRGIRVRIANKIFSKKSYSLSDVIDCYTLLTKQMADYMNINKPYCVVEGIATDTEYYPIRKTKFKTIMYAGTLNKRFGVMNLVNAFQQIDRNEYRLVICGLGDCENEIIEASKEDNRIEFLGQVSRDEVLRLLKEATVLVNPRQNTEEFTKYSFPSKNLEYLSIGRPVIAYPLDGIPDEYNELFYYVNDNSIESLMKTIVDVCETGIDALNSECAQKREYVLNRKSSIEQSRKIVQLIEDDRNS